MFVGVGASRVLLFKQERKIGSNILSMKLMP
jgi:ATP-dependent Zn protease